MQFNKFIKKAKPIIKKAIDVSLMDIKNISDLIINFAVIPRYKYSISYENVCEIGNYHYYMYLYANNMNEARNIFIKEIERDNGNKTVDIYHKYLKIKKIEDIEYRLDEPIILSFLKKRNSLLRPGTIYIKFNLKDDLVNNKKSKKEFITKDSSYLYNKLQYKMY